MIHTIKDYFRWGSKKAIRLPSPPPNVYDAARIDPFANRRKINCNSDIETEDYQGTEVVKTNLKKGISVYDKPNVYFTKETNWFRLPKGTSIEPGFIIVEDDPILKPGHSVYTTTKPISLEIYMKKLVAFNDSWVLDNSLKSSTPSGYGEAGSSNTDTKGLHMIESAVVYAVEKQIKQNLSLLGSGLDDEDILTEIAELRRALSEFERVGRDRQIVHNQYNNGWMPSQASSHGIRAYSTVAAKNILSRDSIRVCIQVMENSLKNLKHRIATEEIDEDMLTDHAECAHALDSLKILLN